MNLTKFNFENHLSLASPNLRFLTKEESLKSENNRFFISLCFIQNDKIKLFERIYLIDLKRNHQLSTNNHQLKKMYRIISGKWKAKRISAPKNFDVRPTTDFAKEALFSIIENRFRLDYSSISVLDLFAGIGSLTLEFASRECKDVTSVEMNGKHATFINMVATELDMQQQINVHRADVYEYLKKNRNRKTYQLIVADPPFETEESKYNELISLVLNNNYLDKNGVFILEHQSRTKLQHPNLLDTRKYGNVSFSFFEPNKEEVLPENSDPEITPEDS